MEFTDYYARLGVARTATQADIKRAYRKLARKYQIGRASCRERVCYAV